MNRRTAFSVGSGTLAAVAILAAFLVWRSHSQRARLSPKGNAILIIQPYWHAGTWVFDDPATGLVKEPFVVGIPEIIDGLVKDIPDARSGFRLLFSRAPFPGYQAEAVWVKAERGGNWYAVGDPPKQGWLCPAMFRYFDHAPKKLYVKAEPLKR